MELIGSPCINYSYIAILVMSINEKVLILTTLALHFVGPGTRIAQPPYLLLCCSICHCYPQYNSNYNYNIVLVISSLVSTISPTDLPALAFSAFFSLNLAAL